MVASANGDLYTPFPHMPAIEEGFQSSEEGSDLHSPIFEAPYTNDPRYHLGHLNFHDVATHLLPPSSSFDARYTVPGVSPHLRDPHILETLQAPSPATIHHLPPHPHPDTALHEQPILDLAGLSSTRLQSPLTSPTEYSFHLPQTRLSEPQQRISNEPPHVPSNRHAVAMPSAEHKPQISLPSSSGKGSASGSNGAPTRPQRREASTVVIACRQCRARKIRCDSTRPVCHNCTRRNNECEYDAVPKRRGPDKRPGTRQRSCKKRPPDAEPAAPSAKKKRKVGSEGDPGVLAFDMKVKENVTGGAQRAQPLARGGAEEMPAMRVAAPAPLLLETSIPPRGTGSDIIYPKDDLSPSFRRSSVIMSFATPVDVNVHTQPHEEEEEKSVFIPISSPIDYSRKTWWDELLDTYNPTSRDQSCKEIFADLNFLFTTSSYWLSFINIPVFFRDLRDPTLRARMQPCLIMSSLALATLMRSSEIEMGSAGRQRALWLRNLAHQSLEAACSNQSVDYAVAEAALILALFESSCHPFYTIERANDALLLLDRLIQVLQLLLIDSEDRDVNAFPPRVAPVVYLPHNYRPPHKCSCVPPPPNSPIPPEHLSFTFHFNPPWDPNWTESEMRKEECRRLCWSALTLVASHTAQCSAFHEEPLDLALSNPSNYALLFPGEAFERAPGHQQASGQSPKESVWALYCRSMLLWSSCIRQRDESWTTEERAKFAIDAFTETRTIQDALDMHECNLDTGLMYVCREYLYNTRMTITYELRRRLQDADSAGMPIFNRRQAEEWLYYQDQVAKRVKLSVLQLGEAPGHLLSRRPFQVTWFSSQVNICLALWEYDRSLMSALELAKTFLIPLDVLIALWPCPAQRLRCDELRHRLEDACTNAGIHPPLPADLTLPPILRT